MNKIAQFLLILRRGWEVVIPSIYNNDYDDNDEDDDYSWNKLSRIIRDLCQKRDLTQQCNN